TNNLDGTTSQARVSELTKRGALTYKVTEEVSSYGSYAESVAPPSIGAEPARGIQWQAGVKYQPLAFPARCTAAAYDLTKTDTTPSSSVPNQPEPHAERRVRGVDLEATAQVLTNLARTTGYSRIMSEIVETATAGKVANELSFVPNHGFS